MALRVGLLFLVVALAAVAAAAYPTEQGAYGLGPAVGVQGPFANPFDQLVQDDMMESDSTRRQLGQAGHISYDAMAGNRIPCNRRGTSYYSNCRGHQQANPYTRGCTRITNCARSNR